MSRSSTRMVALPYSYLILVPAGAGRFVTCNTYEPAETALKAPARAKR